MEAVALAQLGPDGSVRTIAQGVEKLTGFPPEHYEGSILWAHIHADDRNRTQERWNEYLSEPDGARRNFRARLGRPDDSWCWVEISATLAVEQPGLECIVASIEPFGDGWDCDEPLRQPMVELQSDPPARSDFLRILLNLSADAVIILDDEFRIKWASSGAPVASGWNAEDFSRVAPADLVHPDDLELLAAAIGRWRNAPQDPPPTPVTVRLRHSELGWRWTDIVGRDLRTDPEIRGIAMAMSDADDRVRANDQMAASERRHRKLVQRSHERILLTDREGVITWASEQADGNPERFRRKSIVGHELGATLRSSNREAISELLRTCLENPGSTTTAELLLPTSNGPDQWSEVTTRNLLDDPDVRSIAWNFRDIHEQKALLQEVESASEVFKSLAISSSTGLFEEDTEVGCIDVSPRWEEITGISAVDALGEGWHRMIADNYLDATYVPPTRPGPERPGRARIRRPDGTIRWIDTRTTVARMPDGNLRRFGGIEDVTEKVQAEEERQRFLEIFDLTSDMVMVVGAAGHLIFLNRAGRHFHGLSKDEYADLVGTTWPMNLPRTPGFVDIVREAIDLGRWTGHVDSFNAAGEFLTTEVELLVHRDPDGEIRYFTSVARDITKTKNLEASLEHQARHDDLTGLPNRKALLDDLENLAAHSYEHADLVITALFIDLDHFKVINDSLGHEVGDRVLRECGERITSAVRPGETVARFGGDEFVVVYESVTGPSDGDAIAERIESALSKPFEIDGHQVHTTVSVGIASADATELDPHELIRDADTAMYHAKSAGRRRWATFDGELRRAVVERQQMENGLRRALDADELYLEFQPVALLENHSVVGAESLMRWKVNGHNVAPDDFIPVAEDTGLIGPIGSWVLSSSLRQLSLWDSATTGVDGCDTTGVVGAHPMGISVNVSVRQLQSPGFVQQVAEILESSGLGPSRVTLEITETVLLAELTTTGGVLEDLKGLGVNIALDDFGTGYSPLTYLKELPIDEVKLDRSFVAELGTDERARAIAAAVVRLAHAMSLRIVAEGIETEAERRVLRELGCTYGQGTLISPPLPAAALERLIGVAD